MNKFFKICLVFSLFILTACGTPKSQKALENFISTAQNEKKLTADSPLEEKTFVAIAKKASYKIKNVVENGDMSEIDISIKAINIPAYMGEYMQQIMLLALTGTNEETMEIIAIKFFDDLTKREDLMFVEKDLKVILKKENNNWDIVNIEDLTSAIIGGMDKVFDEALDEILSENDPDVDDGISREYKAALNKANFYANNMNMSKKAVYEQLTSEYGENFPKDAADYAIENVESDWKENALNKAISYQQDMNMSRKSIYEQLISEYGEKFTKEEADYALKNLPE